MKCPDCKKQLVKRWHISDDVTHLEEPYYHCPSCNQDYDAESVEASHEK